MRLNLFGFLMPREAAFTELFCEQSRKVFAAAEELRAIINGDGSVDEHMAAITRLEVEADGIAREIFLAGNHTFNAPIDRENILGLAHELDDIVDLVEDTANEIKRYEVREFPDEMKMMADAVLQSASTIQETIPLLDSVTREHRRVFALCERIGQIEGKADACFDTGLTRLRGQLRRSEIDTIAYIDLKEIYEHLEQVVDKCDDVANEIRTITAKHV